MSVLCSCPVFSVLPAFSVCGVRLAGMFLSCAGLDCLVLSYLALSCGVLPVCRSIRLFCVYHLSLSFGLVFFRSLLMCSFIFLACFRSDFFIQLYLCCLLRSPKPFILEILQTRTHRKANNLLWKGSTSPEAPTQRGRSASRKRNL